MGKKILVVVDVQYDFCNPNGALYVNGADKLYDKIEGIIPDFDHVIFTADWHPIDHCSFVGNGGQWPMHCVAGSIGAGTPVEFFAKANSFTVSTKGEDSGVEEYGAFSSRHSFAIELDYNFEHIDGELDEAIENILNSDYEIVICGVAGDYCVLETLKNIVSHIGTDKINVYLDGVASIDGGEKLNNFIKENNIKIYKYESDN